MDKIKGLYKNRSDLSREMISDLCLIKLDKDEIFISFFMDTLNCTIFLNGQKEESIILMIDHFPISELIPEDKPIFEDIWEDLTKYDGWFSFLISSDIGPEALDYAVEIVMRFHEAFVFTRWHDSSLEDFPDKQEIRNLFCRKPGFLLSIFSSLKSSIYLKIK